MICNLMWCKYNEVSLYSVCVYELNKINVYILGMIFFFKQKTAYEMRISDWSSDVCSSDLSCPLMNAPNSQSLTATPAWRALNLHAAEMMRVRIQDLFAQDARRHRRFTCEDVGFYLDFSKQRANEQTMMLQIGRAHV